MPVIVTASSKGGAGKSTTCVLLATEFARAGAQVTAFDLDPNRSLSRWAEQGTPTGITIQTGVGPSEIVSAIRRADGDGKIVVVDLEGVASQLVSRAISQADLVLIPMQPTALDAAIGSEAVGLVREEEETLARPIPHAVVLTRTNAAVRSRVQAQLEEQLEAAGIDLVRPFLVARAAFAEIFATGGDLTSMAANPAITTAGNIETARANAQQFMEAVYDRLIATQ